MWKNLFGAVVLLVSVGVVTAAAQGWSVVTDGRFTNIYVYQPTFAGESWEHHMDKLRPGDAAQFYRASIDHFTDVLMTPGSPSYFDWLYQYSGIHPPRFFGSGVALQRCVDAAIKDAKSAGGVMQWDTIRSLANCHNDGEDPSPQVALIFSPDIKIAKIAPFGTSGDMCATGGKTAWHAWGLSVPNFIALPTDPGCAKTFEDLTSHLSHEIVETLSDPGTVGEGGIWAADPEFESEVGDRCNDTSKDRTTWSGFTITKYWSNSDNSCQPQVDRSAGTHAGHDWLDSSALPLKRFKEENNHDLSVAVNPRDVGQQVQTLQVLISTGGDDLRGGNDNCDVTILLKDGRTLPTLPNVNQKNKWKSWTINIIDIPLPAGGLKGGDVTGITLHKSFPPGFNPLDPGNPHNRGPVDSPDNWNVERLQLRATVQAKGSPIPRPPVFPTTTVTVTVSRIGVKPGTGPRPRPEFSALTYAMIRIVDSEFERSPFSSQSMITVGGGDIPIQIQIWEDLPDYVPPGACKDPKYRQLHIQECMPHRNLKQILRTLNVVYNLKTYEFTVRGEAAATLHGKAGVEFVFPGDGAHPEVAFTITYH